MIPAVQIKHARSVRIEDELARRGFPFWTKPRNNNLGQPCPMCGGADRFSVNTRKQVWRCRACNESGGDIISLVRQIDGCGFIEAVEALTGKEPQSPALHSGPAGATSLSPAKPDRDDSANHHRAGDIWRAAVDPRGTLVEQYLKSRALELPDEAAFEAIRFHPACRMATESHPAMICLVPLKFARLNLRL